VSGRLGVTVEISARRVLGELSKMKGPLVVRSPRNLNGYQVLFGQVLVAGNEHKARWC